MRYSSACTWTLNSDVCSIDHLIIPLFGLIYWGGQFFATSAEKTVPPNKGIIHCSPFVLGDNNCPYPIEGAGGTDFFVTPARAGPKCRPELHGAGLTAVHLGAHVQNADIGDVSSADHVPIEAVAASPPA